MPKWIEEERVFKCPKNKEYFSSFSNYCDNCPYFKGNTWYKGRYYVICDYKESD